MNAATLITGASRGIGRGIALELARLGTDLANRIWPGVAGAPLTLSPEQFLEAVVLVKSVRG